MKPKAALIFSIALTIFAITAVAGVLVFVFSGQTASANASAAPAATDTPAVAEASPDPALVQAMQEREVAYQDLIAQANARLAQDQQDRQTLEAQLQALQAAPAPAAAPTEVTPESAAQTASAYLGRSDMYSVEKVSFRGTPAYLVTFSSGDLVYVGLDGQVLYSQPMVQASVTISQPPAPAHKHKSEKDGSDD